MDNGEIQQRVVKVVCDILSVSEDMVEPDSNFVFDLGAESTQSVQLVAAFEEEFGIEMDAESALAVETVGGAVAYIAKYVNA